MHSPELLRLADIATDPAHAQEYREACRALTPCERLALVVLLNQRIHGPDYAARGIERVITWE